MCPTVAEGIENVCLLIFNAADLGIFEFAP
jgi:hypothetical protein